MVLRTATINLMGLKDVFTAGYEAESSKQKSGLNSDKSAILSHGTPALSKSNIRNTDFSLIRRGTVDCCHLDFHLFFKGLNTKEVSLCQNSSLNILKAISKFLRVLISL